MLAHRGRHCRVRDLILPGPAWGSGDQPVECDADERAVLPMLWGSFDELSFLEPGAGADQGDEVRRVDRPATGPVPTR